MPFKSLAQREKMEEMVRNGKMTQKKFDEMEEGTKHPLPDRIHPKKDASK